MKASEILELIRAGYTKEEIASLDDTTESAGAAATTPAQPTRTEPGQAQAQETTETAAAGAQPAAQPAAAGTQPAAPTDGITAVLAKMTKTLQAMQAANVTGSNNPGPQTSAEKSKEILANIIAPKKGK